MLFLLHFSPFWEVTLFSFIQHKKWLNKSILYTYNIHWYQKKITYWQKCCYLNVKLKNENKLFALQRKHHLFSNLISVLLCAEWVVFPPLIRKKISHSLQYLPPAFQIFLVCIPGISLQLSSSSWCCCSTSSPTKIWIRGP